jgi:kinesin family protein 3/17
MSGTESVQVMVRCRPLNEQEKASKQQNIVSVDAATGQVTVQDPEGRGSEGERHYTFDAVFDEKCSQSDIFTTAALPIVDSALSGFNGTIFAYGQTGTGKTHTMDGKEGEERGIIPRSFEHLFNSIRESGQTKYLVQVSFLEIYQERIRDLLTPGDPKNEGSGLAICDTPEGGVKVKELRTEVVESVPAMLKLLEVRFYVPLCIGDL